MRLRLAGLAGSSLGILCLLSVGLLFVGGCGPESKPSSKFSGEYPYQIVATCGMVTDIVKNVAGEKAEVTGLMGAGVDPHTYKPTVDDVAKLSSADVVFYSGLVLEGRMTDAFLRISRTGKPVYAVTELIDVESLIEVEEEEWDPHVWMDVSAWIKGVEAVSKALGEFDPANAAVYKKNAGDYIAELEKLDAYCKKVVSSIPEQQRHLITAHDAFQYFARRYGIEVKSAQGLSPESKPSVKDIQELVEFIVEHRIKTIFVETSVNESVIDTIVKDVNKHEKANDLNAKIGGTLYSDAMGPAGTYEGTYIGMLDHNATLIALSLGGQAPEKGMQGKLTLISKYLKPTAKE